MGRLRTFVLIFVPSILIGGFVQQTLMLGVLHANEPISAIIPLAILVLLISIAFTVVSWRTTSAFALNQTAVWIGGLLVAAGIAALVAGFLNLSPGIGGDILAGLAILLDVGFLLPGLLAVVIHWWLLRRLMRHGPLA